jgi:hypothetical protein
MGTSNYPDLIPTAALPQNQTLQTKKADNFVGLLSQP